MDEYSKELQEEVRDYWAEVYTQVGLTDIEPRVQLRLKERDGESRRIANLEHMLNLNFGNGQKHLIVGTGTGGLAVELYKKGCTVYGVEPHEKANRIVRLIAQEFGMPLENFTTDTAESLPFKNNTFDFIHCFTVIEHVENVKKSLLQMIKVLKPNGYIYINTHDYRFPYERHYKIVFPAFLPKVFGYLYLLLKGKPLKFLRHINYVTEGSINKILYECKEPISWQRIYERYSYLDWKGFHPRYSLWRFFTLVFNIPMNQEILIRKKGVS